MSQDIIVGSTHVFIGYRDATAMSGMPSNMTVVLFHLESQMDRASDGHYFKTFIVDGGGKRSLDKEQCRYQITLATRRRMQTKEGQFLGLSGEKLGQKSRSCPKTLNAHHISSLRLGIWTSSPVMNGNCLRTTNILARVNCPHDDHPSQILSCLAPTLSAVRNL